MYHFAVVQNGKIVANTHSEDREDARRKADMCAVLYRSYGEVEVRELGADGAR